MIKRHTLASILAKRNRGLLLDLFVFVANLFLLRLLTGVIIDLFQQVDDKDPLPKFALGCLFLGMWILPALGAVLKRWHVHRRKAERLEQSDTAGSMLTGCLFNPIFYFCLNLVLTAVVLTSLGEFLFGKSLSNNGAVFVPFIIGGMVLTIFQTYLIYSYFIPPKKPPRFKYLLTPQSETLGDICLFLNMILFQVMWNILAFAPLGRPSGFLEFAGRLFFLCFVALLIYFPPRMFYLIEEVHRKRAWLTMLLANSPVIVRVLIGTKEPWS